MQTVLSTYQCNHPDCDKGCWEWERALPFPKYSADTVMHTLTALITVHNSSTISCNLCICNSAPQSLGQWLLQEIQADWYIRAVNQGSFTSKLLPRDNKQLLKLIAWSSAPTFVRTNIESGTDAHNGTNRENTVKFCQWFYKMITCQYLYQTYMIYGRV